MLTVVIFAVAVLAWAGFVALVKRDQGWVGISDYRRIILRFTGRMVLLADQIADGLTPAFRAMAKSAAKLKLAFDTSPLIEEPDE